LRLPRRAESPALVYRRDQMRVHSLCAQATRCAFIRFVHKLLIPAETKLQRYLPVSSADASLRCRPYVSATLPNRLNVRSGSVAGPLPGAQGVPGAGWLRPGSEPLLSAFLCQHPCPACDVVPGGEGAGVVRAEHPLPAGQQLPGPRRPGDSTSTAAIDPQSYWPTRPSIATTRSFHLDNRNIDRRNDANTAEFTRTGQGPANRLSCPVEGCESTAL
jgi:hypothetical protein